MIVLERVASFLREYDRGCFCDECLKELLDVSTVERVGRFSRALGETSEFRLLASACSICGREKRVIQAIPGANSHPLNLISHGGSDGWRLKAL